jgi:hypothetical protein
MKKFIIISLLTAITLPSFACAWGEPENPYLFSMYVQDNFKTRVERICNDNWKAYLGSTEEYFWFNADDVIKAARQKGDALMVSYVQNLKKYLDCVGVEQSKQYEWIYPTKQELANQQRNLQAVRTYAFSKIKTKLRSQHALLYMRCNMMLGRHQENINFWQQTASQFIETVYKDMMKNIYAGALYKTGREAEAGQMFAEMDDYESLMTIYYKKRSYLAISQHYKQNPNSKVLPFLLQDFVNNAQEAEDAKSEGAFGGKLFIRDINLQESWQMQQFCELVIREGKTETPIMWKCAKAWLEYLSGKKQEAIKDIDAAMTLEGTDRMKDNARVIGLDLNECNTISLFGVQGAGKSYTIGSITEMVLRQFSKVNLLPAPMASVIFHYSDSMDYAPEFTSMVYPNDEAGQLAKLKAEYGAEPGCIKDVILLAPESQVETRKEEYPDIEVHPIGFDSSELAVRDWMFLLGAMGNDSTYIKELKQIMKACRNDMSLINIRNGVANSNHMSTSQRSLAEQKLDFAEEYISDGNKLQQYMKPGRLIIVDLRDEFIEKDEALGLFVVMLNIFSSVLKVDGRAFNKFIVFDEAHKYMNNKELVGSITTAIREMRHKGVSIMIASQDPMSLPTEIIELSSIVVMHRFSSPAWVKHVQKAITPLQTLTATEMATLGSGEAYLWANKATDKAITQRPIKISIRPRVTKHGGDTIQAVK